MCQRLTEHIDEGTGGMMKLAPGKIQKTHLISERLLESDSQVRHETCQHPTGP